MIITHNVHRTLRNGNKYYFFRNHKVGYNQYRGYSCHLGPP